MVAPTDLAVAVLLVGMCIAGAYDVAVREVPDNLWRVLGLVGAAVGGFTLSSEGEWLPVVLWLVVAAYALQYFFPWTDGIAARYPRAEALIDVALALVAIAVVGVSIALVGLGPAQVPYAVVATLVVTLVSRGLYEAHLLAGAADAKALISMGVVLPLLPTSLIDFGSASAAFLGAVPFAFNALVDAALLTLVAPLAVALRNLRAHEFRWPGGFTTYSIPTEELAHRFVWVDDPALPEEMDLPRDEGTTEEDVARRTREMEVLRGQGVTRIRVTPQLPFVLFLALGTIVGVVAGNLLWDLIVLL